jgi:hypothetical protein
VRAAVLALVVAAQLVVPVAAAPRAAAQPSPSPAGVIDPPANAVSVRISELDAVVSSTPGDRVRLRVELVNTWTEMDRIRVLLLLGPPLHARSQLREPPDARPPDLRPAAETVWRSDTAADGSADPQLAFDDFAAGSSRSLTIEVPVEELGIAPPAQTAVFPLRVAVTSFNEALVGAADTFVVWEPTAPAQPLRLGWVVPVADVPHRDLLGRHIGEDLQGSLSPGGRLDTLLGTVEEAGRIAQTSGGKPLRLTLALDADLVEAVDEMTEPYRVVRGGGPEEARPASPDAGRWLQRLRSLAAQHAVVALPYADADVAALTHARRPGTATALVRYGRGRLRELGLPPAAALAWPADGRLDVPTAASLAGGGVTATVLSEAVLPALTGTVLTPTAVAPFTADGRTFTGVVADTSLTELTSDVEFAAGGPLLGEQLLVADSALLHAERPGVPRDAVVTLPRLWAPDRVAAAGVLARVSATPWVVPTAVADMVADGPRATERVTELRPLTRQARAAELPRDAVRAAAAQRVRFVAFSQLREPTSDPGQTEAGDRLAEQLTGWRVGISRAFSVQWRGRPAGPALLTAQAAERLAELSGRITVALTEVTLTSTTGRVPVTVVNTLGTPVRVRLRLQSERLLTFGHVPDTPVPPGQHTIAVSFKAETVGRFRVTAQLYTATDRAVSPPVEILVRTTAYGPLALAVTGAAFGLLVLIVVVRLLLRRRRGKPPVGADEPAPAPPPLVPVGSDPS